MSHSLTQTYLAPAKRVVIKIGSALLADGGELRAKWLDSLADDIAKLRQTPDQSAPRDILVVSSGAIALGHAMIGTPPRTMVLADKQAAAAIGQIRLSSEWQQALGQHGMHCAQVLLSHEDTETRHRHLNARATLLALLKKHIIPVINENDTVATAKIRFGDNDRLAARVAQMVSADALILLSDIDGLYTSDPRQDASAQHIPEVTQITEAMLAAAGPASHEFASGGMITKMEAAQLATSSGCNMVICRGSDHNPIGSLLAGGRCSWFRANKKPMQARKVWIAGGLNPKGHIAIDAGASRALMAGKSLLAAGITEVKGNFVKGDLVSVVAGEGIAIGRGLSRYNANDINRIKGHKSGEISGILGYRGHDEIIHADDLVLVEKRSKQEDAS
ncbi:MAG: glutamate 5-kinase [Proteobacteria bacterium]|nr:glutamate 5-kinase [Pseudomonadota bacterium]